MEASAPTPASMPDQARRLTISLSVMAAAVYGRARASRFQAAADRGHDVVLRALVGALALVEQAEDPSREHLLDRPVEGHGGELGGHVGAELPRALRLLHDPADEPVGLR